MKTLFPLWICLFLLLSTAFSQAPKVKQGKVSKSDFEIPTFVLEDPSGPLATVLYEEVDLNFLSPQMAQYKYFLRILILEEGGNKYGDFEFETRSGFGAKEEITGISGAVYNLVDREIEKSKLGRGGIQTIEVHDRLQRISVKMPDVRKGSIIELSYVLSTELIFTLPPWQFQREIPVCYSKAKFIIPERIYKPFMVGEHPLHTQEFSSQPSSYSTTSMGQQGRSTMSTKIVSQVEYGTNGVYEWSVVNVPGISDEPFARNYQDFLTRMELGVEVYQYSTQEEGDFTTQDEWLNFFISESPEVGEWLAFGVPNHTNFVLLSRNFETDKEKAEAIFKEVQDHIYWNGDYSTPISRLPLVVWQGQNGSTQEINLMLVGALKAIEMEAYPVMLSSRSHGRVFPKYPQSDGLDYIVAGLRLDGEWIFLDASQKHLRFGELPLDAHNQYAFLSGPEYGWKEMIPPSRASKTSTQLSVEEGGTVTAAVSMVETDLAAQERRRLLTEDTPVIRPMDSVVSMVSAAWTLDESEWEMRENGDVGYQATFELESVVSNGPLVINPYIMGVPLDFPFAPEGRTLPVDFGSLMSRTWQATMLLPEGYTFVSVPVDGLITMESQKAAMRYKVNQMGNMISLSAQLKIGAEVFLPSEYADLIEFLSRCKTALEQPLVIERG